MSLNNTRISEIAHLARQRKSFVAAKLDDNILIYTLSANDLPAGIQDYDSDKPQIGGFTICRFDKSIVQFKDLPINGSGIDESRLLPSTTRPEYERSVKRAIFELRKTGYGKTVVSRVIYGETFQALEDILQALMSGFGNTCRFIFYTPSTGLWLGASPEILIHNSPANGSLSTMALAGTRDSRITDSWDHKNQDEHRIVVDFIVDTLRAHGLNPKAAPTSELRYGDITHLFTPITSDYSPSPHALLRDLSPTPALGGYPVDDAIDRINRIEGHDRQCYGGYLSFDMTDGNNISYVILRCAHLQLPSGEGPIRYNVYAGGGITGESNVDDEWNETTGKAERLIEILDNASSVLARSHPNP